MTREEWDALLLVAHERWFLLETDGWFDDLADLEGGYVAVALARFADDGATPTPAGVRRAVNHLVRADAAAAPLPTGFLRFREWLERGVPTWNDAEPDRARARSEVEAIFARVGWRP